ncbi:hypothetical protein [Mucilaginibacter hurinus]|nr:hypothetical protein [Mucilaginibacter hurinus]
MDMAAQMAAIPPGISMITIMMIAAVTQDLMEAMAAGIKSVEIKMASE